MRDLAVFDMAACLYHLKPANLAQCARGAGDAVLKRVVNTFFRRTGDLNEVTSVKVVEIGVEFEVAIDQAARGGSFAGSASTDGGVSSAYPRSACSGTGAATRRFCSRGRCRSAA